MLNTPCAENQWGFTPSTAELFTVVGEYIYDIDQDKYDEWTYDVDDWADDMARVGEDD